jgi:hypothetical protein
MRSPFHVALLWILLLATTGCRKQAAERKSEPGPRVIAADAMVPATDAVPVEASAGISAPADASGISKKASDDLGRELEVTSEPDVPKRYAALSRDQLVGLVQWTAVCPVVLRAARELATRGDATYLPQRPATDDAATIGRALCMIAMIEDERERRTALRAYLPTTGKVAWSREDCPGDNGNEKGGIVEGTVTRDKASGRELAGYRYDEGCKAGPIAGQHVCSGVGPGSSVEVNLVPASDGRLYIAKIERRLNTGCY